MLIDRGLTDKTPVCVYPWERPLVEEVHGTSAILITIDQMCDKTGAKSTKTLKLNGARRDQDDQPMTPEYAPDLRRQLEMMATVDPDNNPVDDPAAEWGRCVERYGMHDKVEVSVVEKVYGNERTFRACLRDFAVGRVPDFLNYDEEGGEEAEETPLVDMTKAELQEKLTAMGVKFSPSAGKEKLMDLATDAIAEAA